jgi:hypothetical protein
MPVEEVQGFAAKQPLPLAFLCKDRALLARTLRIGPQLWTTSQNRPKSSTHGAANHMPINHFEEDRPHNPLVDLRPLRGFEPDAILTRCLTEGGERSCS